MIRPRSFSFVLQPQRNCLEEKGNLESAGVIPISDLDKTLKPKPIVTEVNRGDLIELIAGPFKGEKAVVKRVDLGKEEITVELYESVVPIPITVRGDHVRVVEKVEDQ